MAAHRPRPSPQQARVNRRRALRGSLGPQRDLQRTASATFAGCTVIGMSVTPCPASSGKVGAAGTDTTWLT